MIFKKSLKRISLFLGFLIVASSGVNALEVKILKTSSGISFWYSKDESVEIISLAFALKTSGEAYMDGSLPGLMGTYCDMLLEGTEQDSAESFRTKLSQNAIGIGFGSSLTTFSGHLATSRKTQALAQTLFKEALYQATFHQDRLSLYKNQVLAGLENAQKTPGYLLGRFVDTSLFGEQPYGQVHHLTPESASKITPKTLKDLRSRLYNRNSLFIAVCGNLSEDEATDLVENLFAQMPNGEARPLLAEVSMNLNQQENVKPSPYPQSLVRFFAPGIEPSNPDYLKLQLAVDIFGGGLNSRIGEVVREQAGLVYSIGTHLSFLDKVAFLQGNFGSTDENVNEAITLVKQEFQKFVQQGVTAKELEETKTAQIGQFLLSLSSTGVIASRLLAFQLYGFSPDYVQQRTELIQSVTLDELNQFLKAHFGHQELTFFVLGNPVQKQEKN